MAGDWIKLQHVTPDKPEVHQIAARLQIMPEQALGHLLRVWIWVDQQSLDGHALRVTTVTLDSVAQRDGLSAAMREVAWLSGEDGALCLPNFERHNGETAKKRALAADRQQRRRDNTSRVQRDDSVTREEKRRVKIPGPHEPEAQPPPPDLIIWETGVDILKTSGLSTRRARTLLGKHAKLDRDKLAAVIAQMVRQRPVDPVGYLEKAMQPEPPRVAL